MACIPRSYVCDSSISHGDRFHTGRSVLWLKLSCSKYLRGTGHMYKAFYELKRNPFDITADPASFFPTPRHNEALANLSYGVRWRKGFVVLTGEVGTGKTLLLACLLDLLKRVQIASAYIVNPRLTP